MSRRRDQYPGAPDPLDKLRELHPLVPDMDLRQSRRGWHLVVEGVCAVAWFNRRRHYRILAPWPGLGVPQQARHASTPAEAADAVRELLELLAGDNGLVPTGRRG
jgi:hypothetical protein